MNTFTNASSITRLVFDTVPQLYEAENGTFPMVFSIGGEHARLFSRRPCTPEIRAYLEACATVWEDLQPLTDGSITQSIEREWIQQKFAVAWLNARTRVTTWPFVIDYARRLARRTTENHLLSKTLVIELEKSPSSAARMTDENYLKVFDWLGTSALTYFRVDQQLAIKSLEAISLTQVKELESYRFYPDFLHPVIDSIQGTDSVVVHISSKGDLLIADRNGVIASKRKERWTIYDADHMIASLAEILDQKLGAELKRSDPTCVACSLHQILFDMSFKRQGGLLLIDRPENISKYLVKGIVRKAGSALNSIFTHSSFNGLEHSIAEGRKLVELSSVDGALILDPHGNLVQVGSVVVTHPSARASFGTRDTAAYSAAKHGATAFKVSSDGEVSIFFTTQLETGDQVHRMDFS